MNLASRRLTQFTLFAAVAAAGFTVGTAHAAGAPERIIELPRVTVVGHRATEAVRIVELPRVVVIAKRMAPGATPTFIAQRASRPAGV